MTGCETFFYAALGEELRAYAVDSAAAVLTRAGKAELPAWVQYAWRHPSLPVLYVVTSDGGPARGGKGRTHHASALAIDPSTGALDILGSPVPLPARPIHCSVDREGRFLLTAYNDPSGVSVHRIAAGGALGERVAEPESLDFGTYAHQVLATPSNRAVVVPARGNDPTSSTPQDPGALYLFDFDAGRLSPAQRVAPGDGTGYGFGPRHLDFHPREPWVYVSVERQNQLQLYTLDEGSRLSAAPRFTGEALSRPAHLTARPGRQMCGAVRVHPNGRFVYQANRTNGLDTGPDRWRVAFGGEDSLVVWSLDPGTGEPRAVQRKEVPGIHVRTLSIHPGGELLAAATIGPVPVRETNGGVRLVPAAIMVYRIGEDGHLELARKYDVDTAGKMMWWTGFVPVP